MSSADYFDAHSTDREKANLARIRGQAEPEFPGRDVANEDELHDVPDSAYPEHSLPEHDNETGRPSQERAPAPIGQPPRRTSWNATDLLAHEFTDPKFAVDGILAEGLNLLAGPPKVGKSWLGLNIGVAVARGGKALGKIPVKQGSVLYLCLEDTPRRIKNRLKKVLDGQPAPAGLDFATECEAMPGGGARIRTWLDTHPDARLVVVDVWARVRGKRDPRLPQYDSDYAAMAALKVIADEYGVAFLVVHHTRKGEAADFLDSVSGTQGLAGAADAILVLSRSRTSADGLLKLTGRDIEEAEHALKFAGETGTWVMLDGPASEYALSPERQAILAAVRATEGIGPMQIAKASGVKYASVKHLVRTMVDDGQLDTDGAGHYLATIATDTERSQ